MAEIKETTSALGFFFIIYLILLDFSDHFVKKKCTSLKRMLLQLMAHGAGRPAAAAAICSLGKKQAAMGAAGLGWTPALARSNRIKKRPADFPWVFLFIIFKLFLEF